jgi:LuxR family maltose regulon positive regulatory protein
VAALEARTEGWIAGLQLAALSIRGRDDLASFIRAFSGDHRYIVDYLVEEVLRHPIRGRQELLAANLDSRVCTWASANCTASRAICTRRRGTCCEARN